MKATIKLMALAAVLMFASCVQEMPSDQNKTDEAFKEVVLEVSTPAASLTKTMLGDKTGSNYPVYWQQGDVISMNGYLSSSVPQENEGSDVTVFAFNLPEEALSATAFNLIYPGVENVADQVEFKSEQPFVEGTFAQNVLPMYATAESVTSTFSLDYLASVIRVPVKFTAPVSLSTVTLEAVGGEALSGAFLLDKTEEGAFSGTVTASENAGSTISLKFAEGENLFESETVNFHFVVPAGAYSEGLKLSIVDSENGYMEAELFNAEADYVEVGKVYEYTETSYAPDGTVFYIYTPEDLIRLSKFSTIGKVLLMNDIDMTDSGYSSYEFDFYGDMDGQNYHISGLTTPLFNNLRGSVKNLKITANVNYSETQGNEYGVGLLAHYAYPDYDETSSVSAQYIHNVTMNGSLTVNIQTTKDNYNVGGLVGASNGVPVTDCTNNATVSLGADFSCKGLRIGGVIGALQSKPTCDVYNCKNTGKLDIQAKSVTGNIYAGGISGYSTQAIDVEGCSNTAEIYVTGKGNNLYLAGILGQSTANININNLVNSGNITITTYTSSNQIYVGGVLAMIDNATENTYDALLNSGTITINTGITNSSTKSYNYVAGIIGSSDAKNKIFVNCINTGDINMRTVPLKCRVGGVAGIVNKNPKGSKCFADIDFKTSVSNDSHIGGVAGYLNVSEYSDLTYKGNINSNGSSGTNYTGGIVGCTNSGTKTFSSCVVSGTMRGANSGTGMAGVFCNSSKQADYTFDSCKVGSGTIHMAGDGGTANATTITSADQLVVGVLVGGKGASSCTVTNCTVVDPDTITIE